MFGYRSVYEGAGPRPKRRVVLDEKTAPLATAMFQRYADGDSLHSLTKWLNAMGVPTTRNGERWWAANVRRILTNETALGRIAYGRTKTLFDPETEMPRHVISDKEPTRYDGAFPALVSQELFYAVQARLRKNERRRPQGGHPGNLVRGIAFCAKCGWGLAFQKRRAWYYLCETKKQKGAKAPPECCGVLRADYVQEVVLEFLRRLVAVPHYRDVLKEAVRSYNRAASEHQGVPEMEFIAAQIIDLEKALGNLVDSIAMGVAPLSVKERLRKTELDLLDARKRREQLFAVIRSVPKLDEQHILDVARGLRVAIKTNDLPKIKDLLGGLVDRIEVDFTKRKMTDIQFNYKRHTPSPEELLQEVLEQFPGATLQKPSDAFYATFGGRAKFDKWFRETQKEIMSEHAPEMERIVAGYQELLERGMKLDQRVENGRLTTIMDWGAPLTFILKWDPSNLERISEEALRKIGAIAVS